MADESGFILFEVIPVIFLLLVLVVWRFRNKGGKRPVNKNDQTNPAQDVKFTSKHDYKILQSTSSYSFCPYCNTKVENSTARLCHVCHTAHICPQCRKCINKDQHRGI